MNPASHTESQEKKAIWQTFATHVSSGKADFFERAGIEFVLGKREGPFLWDIDGRKSLIDCHCNGGVFNLGHRNPEILETLRESLETLDIGNHHLVSEGRAQLASRLAELLPEGLTYSVFGVGGGEAIDLAIKIARGHTGRSRILSARGGYHGHTGLALAAGDERYRQPFGLSPQGFHQIPFNDLPALAAALDHDVAALLLETIPATYGILIPDAEYLPTARKLCDQNGTLLIIDEIQAGLGRTGELWALQHFEVTPDIMVLGKGLSGGLYPITATCFTEELETVFHQDPFVHVSTFGGAEIGCPVALKVLEISSDPSFLAGVRDRAERFARGLEDIQQTHSDLFIRLRSLGMMIGLEMVSPSCGPLFSKAAFDHGFLSVFANNDPRVAQFLPPLNLPLVLVEDLLERVEQALDQVRSMLM